MATQEIEFAAWMGAFTVADQLAIDELPERLRGAVERYKRTHGFHVRERLEDELNAEISSAVRRVMMHES